MGRPLRTAVAPAPALAAVCALGLAGSLAVGCGGDKDEAAAGSAGSASSGSAGSGSGAADAAGSAGRAARCDSIDASMLARLLPPELRAQLQPMPPRVEARLKAALIAACKRDAWTADALACAALPSQAARDRCPGRLSDDQVRSAHGDLATAALLALAEPLPGSSRRSTLGPHPDFPTPALAGTDKLFTLIEPDRGPKAPLGMTIPRAGLRWTTHATCDIDVTGPICTPEVDDPPGLFHWKVGRRGNDLIVAEGHRGARIDRTFVYLRTAAGAPLQRVRFDAYDRVESALLFKAPDRYSGRRRNGANALDGCGHMAYQLDAAGRTTEQTCLQWQGDPMLDTDGVAKLRVVRDALGFAAEEARFDLAGKPVASAAGVHKTRYERDALSRVQVERYRGVDDKPVASTSGCFGYRLERDAQGALLKKTCLDAADHAMAQAQTGTSSEAYRVNDAGCRISMRYLNVAGAPSSNHELVHATDYEVDERCQITARTCKDTGDRPRTCTAGGPVRYVTRFDAAGNPVSVKHYGPLGVPGRDPNFHAFELRRTYDRLGNQLTQSCHDTGGAPVTCSNTDFHALRSTYDDAARETLEKYVDEAGAATDNYGAYQRTYKYDNYDHLIETQNHDARGALSESFGVAIRKDLYDAAHRRFGLLLYDKNGQPASNSGCYTGATCPAGQPWHAVRIARRPDGTVEKNLFFDTARKLIDTRYCSATPCFD